MPAPLPKPRITTLRPETSRSRSGKPPARPGLVPAKAKLTQLCLDRLCETAAQELNIVEQIQVLAEDRYGL